MSGKILCVDDDLNILSAFQRNLRHQFQIVGALGGEKGLKSIAEHGPFAVVVSDLKMPGMDGLEFLAKVREVSPDSVRLIFTGQADLSTAIAAVNEGNIFRFLTKPCPPEVLSKTLAQALEQHRLIVSERELLEKTLSGSVQVLVDILALVNPAVFSRSSRIQAHVLHIATVLDALAWKWQLELAAMLSQIGSISLSGAGVMDDDGHPEIGAKLIANIPRLEIVAQIISWQRKPFRDYADELGVVPFGAQALHVAIEFDRLRSQPLDAPAALEVMKSKDGEFHPEMVAALATFEAASGPMEHKHVSARELKPKMITLSNLYSKDGALLLAKDLEITGALVEVIARIGQTRGIREPIDVLAPVTAV